MKSTGRKPDCRPRFDLAKVGHCKHGRYESEVWVTPSTLLAEMRDTGHNVVATDKGERNDEGDRRMLVQR